MIRWWISKVGWKVSRFLYSRGLWIEQAEETGFLGNEFCPCMNEGPSGWQIGFGHMINMSLGSAYKTSL